ncbi:hypothetical protein [Clostridium sp. HCS.1]|uniref:hypothetical protein n=1 Tax=Clostridium sp. HCS.1 TaxID=3238594 RepID=UPI003A100817
MLIENKLRKEVTPKRVFSVLKLIKSFNGRLEKKQVYNLIQPMNLVKNQDDVKKTLNFLLEQNMISENGKGEISLIIDKKYLKDLKSFRSYFSENIFKDMTNETLFFKITSEILSKDLDFYEIKNFEDIANYLENREVDKEFILAWRFWAEFLGFGNIINNQFLANPYVRIMERIIDNEAYKETNYKMSGFVSIIKEECPELKNSLKENKVGLSLTLALRTLESLGNLKLVNIKDSTDIWRLYYSAIEKLEVTDIEIVRENK